MQDLDNIFDNPKNWSNLENRVAKILKKFGWSVKENQPYIDPKTDKSREIDIIATKEVLVWDKNTWIDSPEILEMRLFIDCKNLPQPLWLYVRDVDNELMTEALLEKRIYDNLYGNSHWINDKLPITLKSHRYFSESKTAYKSINNDDKNIGIQWVNQVLHAMLSWIYTTRRSYNLDYPVIVIDKIGQLAIESEDETRQFADKNLFYGLDYIVGKEKKYFIIDIVALDTLEIFLEEINSEFNILQKPILEKLFEDARNRSRINENEESGTNWLTMKF